MTKKELLQDLRNHITNLADGKTDSTIASLNTINEAVVNEIKNIDIEEAAEVIANVLASEKTETKVEETKTEETTEEVKEPVVEEVVSENKTETAPENENPPSES